MLPAAALVLAVGLAARRRGRAGALAARSAGPSGARQSAARAELTAELVELLRGAPELVAYGREDETLARVRAADAELARLGRRDALVAGIGDSLSALVAGLTAVGVLAVAVSAHDAGSLDRVLVASLALLALASFEAVAPLPAAARELSATLAAGRRVLELTDREPEVHDPAEPLPPPGRRAVALEGVTARYGAGEAPALEGVSLTLEPGRRVALVGPSGAGKTTVTNLLLRFLDPEQGRVTLAGRDLREYRADDVRRTFALAGQDAHLFDSTIRANLLLAQPDASDDELRRRARAARGSASGSRRSPHGLDTLVGEEGTRISGGQRQRLVLARALLADAPVLAARRADRAPRPRDGRAADGRRARRGRRQERAADHAPARGARAHGRDRPPRRRPRRGPHVAPAESPG